MRPESRTFEPLEECEVTKEVKVKIYPKIVEAVFLGAKQKIVKLEGEFNQRGVLEHKVKQTFKGVGKQTVGKLSLDDF